MSAEPVDHAALARARVAAQYVESLRFLQTIRALADEVQTLEDALLQVAEITDIETAAGVNLDVIGDIVGITRYVPNVIPIIFFGFDDSPDADTFGEEDDPTIGARFKDLSEPDNAIAVLADPEFRILIRAKIIKNHAIGTNEDLIRSLLLLFQDTVPMVEDIGGMEVTVSVGRPLTNLEIAIIDTLDLLPRAAGVKLNLVFDSGVATFGFNDTPNSYSFADAPDGGGVFAELI